jgi:rare lipoprotein A
MLSMPNTSGNGPHGIPLVATILVVLGIALALPLLATVPVPPPPVPLPPSAPQLQLQKPLLSSKMITSWYGPRYHGRPTASGERFNQWALTCASPTMKFGTRLLLKNPKTGQQIVVRVNDRGPYVKGRSLDVSRKAAQLLGMERAGVVPLEVRLMAGYGEALRE